MVQPFAGEECVVLDKFNLWAMKKFSVRGVYSFDSVRVDILFTGGERFQNPGEVILSVGDLD